MRAKLMAAAAAALLLLSGCAGNAAPGAPMVEPPPVEAADSRPDSQIPAARVPIAGVAPEAAGVNERGHKQAEGIKMVPDKDQGLKAGDVSDSALAGGCVPGYGKDGKCLPPIPPRLAAEHAGHRGMTGPEMAKFYTCEDVRALIPDGLTTEIDPLGLDSNKDGIACGQGDKK